ncbi:unnamed protein product [Rodentolepis nana]|uniref:SH2 domain-containing protein n=1 Tax=Rodentolepis nana TaxID=102285 RepID=A0A158QGU6_RODNA|nr:unnamed protein product [Rodentolepis nana]
MFFSGKRNCELPPVPVGATHVLNAIANRQADVLDGVRPYSFCEPSESDPLYASVGVPGAFVSPQNRPEASTSTAVAVAANSIVPPPAKRLNFWSAVDSEGSGGSMALPYYSTIHHDPNRASPVYQEAPTISNGQFPAVYAQVKTSPTSKSVRLRSNGDCSSYCNHRNGAELGGYRRAVKSQGTSDIATGPPVPSRAYRLSEVEQLLNNGQPLTSIQNSCASSRIQGNQQNSRRPRSEASFSGLNLLEMLQSGLRRRQNNSQNQLSNRVSTNRDSNPEPPATVNMEPPIAPRVSGDYSSSTYGSAKSGHYRNITVRESIASLRARNALPTFLSENRQPLEVPSETDYEGVYWYPDENGAEVANERASRSSFGSQVVVEPVTDLGSDAYVEIPGMRDDIYTEPTDNSHEPTPPPPSVQNRNVSRILLEMQDFRYVDSETDLSSSVTPPDIGEEGDTKETTPPSINGRTALVNMPSTSTTNPLRLRKPDLPARSKARKSQNMTPLMERSMEMESSRSPPRSPCTNQSNQRPQSRPLPEVMPSYLIIVHFFWRTDLIGRKMRVHCVFITIFLLTFINHFLARAQDELLEFIPVEGANTEENIYLTDSFPEVLIDATSKITRSIYFLGSTNLVTHVVQFSCQVATRSKALTDVKLCCGGGGSSVACHRLSSQPIAGKISCKMMQFDYAFDKYKGANFSLGFSPIREHLVPYNEKIYCEVEDAEATIQSNIVELRDAIFYKTQLNVTSSNEVLKEYQPEISPQDFPLKFSCGNYAEKIRNWPSWMAAVWQQYLSPFEWSSCQVSPVGITAAGCAGSKKSLGVGGSVTTMDGTLFLLSDTVLAKNPNSAFICLVRGSTASPIRAYGSEVQKYHNPLIEKGFTLNPNSEPSQVQGFINLSPLETSYQFTDGTVLSNFELLAFYRVPESAKSNFKYGWYKDGKKLTDPGAAPNSFRLPNKVERSFSGIYELLIMEGGSLRLKFIFTVSVVGAPTFKDVDCVEDLFYALEGSSKMYTCDLNAGESEEVFFKVGINGFEADSSEALKKILASSLQIQNQPIEKLDIDFRRHDKWDSKGITVEVKNLAVGQNFRLSIKAINAYGQSLVTGTLRVVPKPALQIAPSRLSCATDCNEDPFDLQCIPASSIAKGWNGLGVISQQGWVLARTFTMEMVMEDPDLAQFFAYNSTTPYFLKVSPYIPVADLVKVSDLPTTASTTQASTSSAGTTNLYTATSPPKVNLQEVLSTRLSRQVDSLQLECRFQLFVNNSRAKFVPYSMESVIGGLSRQRREVILDEQKKIYDSYNEEDKTLKDTLTASRTFSDVSKPATANFAWVAAVVIAIVFILIVIIVGVWLCTRNRGETYKLSKKEYKLGNDPIRELKEKETFQTYERP